MNVPPLSPAQYRELAERVSELLQQAGQRALNHQELALEVDAHFRLEEPGAIQFRMAQTLLEVRDGLDQHAVMSELLTRGLQSVLAELAHYGRAQPGGHPLAGAQPLNRERVAETLRWVN